MEAFDAKGWIWIMAPVSYVGKMVEEDIDDALPPCVPGLFVKLDPCYVYTVQPQAAPMDDQATRLRCAYQVQFLIPIDLTLKPSVPVRVQAWAYVYVKDLSPTRQEQIATMIENTQRYVYEGVGQEGKGAAICRPTEQDLARLRQMGLTSPSR